MKLHQEDERDLDEDDVIDDKEIVMNTRMKQLAATKQGD